MYLSILKISKSIKFSIKTEWDITLEILYSAQNANFLLIAAKTQILQIYKNWKVKKKVREFFSTDMMQ
jgi:hypothetical protein